MKTIQKALRPSHLASILAAATLIPMAAHAQTNELQSSYKDHLQYCSTLTDPVRQQACRREAGAALHEARRNRLETHQGTDKTANAVARCQRLPSDQQASCERLMREGTVQQGSVSGGGVLRELTITVPADTTTGGYTTQPAPGTTYQQSPATTGTYQAPPATGTYQTPSATGTYQAPPAAGTYQPAPAVRGTTGTQPGYSR